MQISPTRLSSATPILLKSSSEKKRYWSPPPSLPSSSKSRKKRKRHSKKHTYQETTRTRKRRLPLKRQSQLTPASQPPLRYHVMSRNVNANTQVSEVSSEEISSEFWLEAQQSSDESYQTGFLSSTTRKSTTMLFKCSSLSCDGQQWWDLFKVLDRTRFCSFCKTFALCYTCSITQQVDSCPQCEQYTVCGLCRENFFNDKNKAETCARLHKPILDSNGKLWVPPINYVEQKIKR